jgi:hypothetical protein
MVFIYSWRRYRLREVRQLPRIRSKAAYAVK